MQTRLPQFGASAMIDIKNMGQTFFVVSLIISAYFIFLALDYYFFRIGGDTLFEEVREMITLPLLFFQHIIALLSLIFWIRHKRPFPSYIFFALVLSLCNILVVWL